MEIAGEYYNTCSYQACLLTLAFVTSPCTYIKVVQKNRKKGSSNRAVLEVRYEDCKLSYLPRGLGNYFKGLKYLYIDDCELKWIASKDFDGLENLERISAESNLLKSLPNNLFVNLRKLKFINFDYNKIQFMSSKIFEPIMQNELQEVKFLENTNISSYYSYEEHEKMKHFGFNTFKSYSRYKVRGGVESLEQLMSLIDIKCCEPNDGFGFQNEEFSDTVMNSYKQLWKSKAFSDFTIVVKGPKEFPVHKCVLGTQSSVFAAVFNNDMKEAQSGRMTIEDSSAKAVEQFLAYMYTGCVPSDVYLMDLFALASKYDVQKLKSQCEEEILKHLDETNDIEIFALGYLHSSENMKINAFRQIKATIEDIQLGDDWMDYPDGLENIVATARAQRVSGVKFYENCITF